MAEQHADLVARPWWWNDPETRAWIASGACCCRSCQQDRKLVNEAGGVDG